MASGDHVRAIALIRCGWPTPSSGVRPSRVKALGARSNSRSGDPLRSLRIITNHPSAAEYRLAHEALIDSPLRDDPDAVLHVVHGWPKLKKTVNPQIRTWLDQGRAVEAILGVDRYYLPSAMYAGEHDLALVLSQLFTWAADDDREQDAARALEAAVAQAAEQGDAARAYDIMWGYFLISDDRHTVLPVSRERVSESLATLDPPIGVSDELAGSVQDRVGQLT